MHRRKVVRLNISGNTIFKADKDEIGLIVEDTGMCLEDFKSEEEEEKAEIYRYEHPTTLRDIAILFHIACGQGVMWQFSRALAKKLNIDKKDVQIALEEVVREYANMEESEANKEWNKGTLYIKTLDDGPEEKE